MSPHICGGSIYHIMNLHLLHRRRTSNMAVKKWQTILAAVLVLLAMLSIPGMMLMAQKGYDKRIISACMMYPKGEEGTTGKACFIPEDFQRYQHKYPVDLLVRHKSHSSLYCAELNQANQLDLVDEDKNDYKTQSQAGSVFILVEKDKDGREQCFRYAFVKNLDGQPVAITEDLRFLVFGKMTGTVSWSKVEFQKAMRVEGNKLILKESVPGPLTEQQKDSLYYFGEAV